MGRIEIFAGDGKIQLIEQQTYIGTNYSALALFMVCRQITSKELDLSINGLVILCLVIYKPLQTKEPPELTWHIFNIPDYILCQSSKLRSHYHKRYAQLHVPVLAKNGYKIPAQPKLFWVVLLKVFCKTFFVLLIIAIWQQIIHPEG